MSDPVIPPVEDDPNSPRFSQLELLRFLSEESRKNREALREETKAVTELFIRTSKIVAWPLSIAIGLAGIFFFHNLSEMKQEMVNEARSETTLEIQKMRQQIDETLQEQFKTERIQVTIKNAAEIATQKEAKPLIEAGVRSEVGKAVAAQSGMIQKIAVQAVDDKVQEAVAPLASQAKESVNAQHVQELIARADSDDAKAFDELLSLRDKGSVSQRTLIDSVIADRNSALLSRPFPNGQQDKCADPKSQQVLASLESENVDVRKAALGNCFRWIVANGYGSRVVHPPQPSFLQLEVEIAQQFVKVAMRDSSLSVRAQAVSSINTMFASSPGFPPSGLPVLELENLKLWWQSNKDNCAILLLLARVESSDSPYYDSADLYDDLLKTKPGASPALTRSADEALAQMRSLAPKRVAFVRSELSITMKPKYDSSSCQSISRDHGCPVKSRTESVVWEMAVTHPGDRTSEVPVKWGFSRKG